MGRHSHTTKKKHRGDSTTGASSSSQSYSSSSDDSYDSLKRVMRLSRRSKTKKKHRSASSSCQSDSSSSGDSYDSLKRGMRRFRDKRKSDVSSKKLSRKRKNNDGDRGRERRHRRKDEKGRSRRRPRRKRHSEGDDAFVPERDDTLKPARSCIEPKLVVKNLLRAFPNVANELKQLLQMIDDGQAVDVKGMSNRSLVKLLKALFASLDVEENGEGVYLLPSNVCRTLAVVGPLIDSHVEHEGQAPNDVDSRSMDADCGHMENDNDEIPRPSEEMPGPGRRIMGPEMPSADLLAAAAKLTEAMVDLREAEVDEDTELFIGPPPPAVVSEAESANEAERFEEVTRIIGAEASTPYDILGVNHNMSFDNIKKRYWKLSLMVHPDKCSHPQAHRAFIILNKAFKDLQDPNKRKALDDEIKLKEEREEFKVKLQEMREAAQWRKMQGILMEGDDELLADLNIKAAPKRDEWMTTLPPERKPGMTMHSRKFSRTGKEGRGDTSVWTDTPSDKAQKAKMNYLEAYNEVTAVASNEDDKKRAGAYEDLVDKFNKAKRSKSLVEKHQETAAGSSGKKLKPQPRPEKREEWVGKHPWKPWDREKDLAGGRQSVKFDQENMAQGLTSRFSSGFLQIDNLLHVQRSEKCTTLKS